MQKSLGLYDLLLEEKLKKPLVPGANWGTWENEKCSSCFEKTTIVYKLVIQGKIFVSECADCLADHF